MDGTIHHALPSELGILGKLSDQVFRSLLSPGTGIPRELPRAFSVENAHNLYWTVADGKPVALLATLPTSLHIHGAGVSAVSMGAVCTLPEYRGRHYASGMLQQVLSDFRESASLLLISGDQSIYRRIGSVGFGARIDARILPDSLKGEAARQFLYAPLAPPVSPELIDQLSAIYAGEPCSFARNADAFEQLIGSLCAPRWRDRPVAPLMFGAFHEGVAVAYLAASLVHHGPKWFINVVEWAGRRDAVAGLITSVMSWYDADGIGLYAHTDDLEMLSVLQSFRAMLDEVPNLGTLRVINPGRLVSELQPYLQRAYGAHLLIEDASAPRLRWSVADPRLPSIPDDGRVDPASLGSWLFGRSGLCIPLPHTDDLSYL